MIPAKEPELSREQQIEQALTPLIGLPLSDMHRVSSLGLQMFEFGQQRLAVNRRGQPITLADWSLHVFCDWRVTGPMGPVFGHNDYLGGAEPVLTDTAQVFFSAVRAASLAVLSLEAGDTGRVRFTLNGDYTLELTPLPNQQEYWRLLPPGEDAAHFVIGAEGIE
jgi:hypothetical protein